MPASRTCPSCGSTVPADASFCPYCGERVGETTEIQRAPRERVHVFGATPAGTLLVLAAAALGASAALLVFGRLPAAAVAFLVAVALGAVGARLLVRDGRSPLARRAVTAVDRGR